jgi:hypothetical protein
MYLLLSKSSGPFLLALLCLVSASSLQAMPRLGVERTGVIVKVDLNSRQMVMRRGDTSETLTFTWNRRTVFVAGSHIVAPSSIAPRDHVQIIYHRPLFGNPFITRLRVQHRP